MTNIALTIFTPAYNRAHTLGRLFESLENQTLKNFEWLIIDDGSEDDTKNVVDELIKKTSFPIRYFKQDNRGKQMAWNSAVELAMGSLFCCLDSDDALYDKNNIADIYGKYYSYLSDDMVFGLRMLAYSNVKEGFDGVKLSSEVVICSYFDELSDHKNYGERIDFFKTSILKSFLFPIEPGIKFIPEIWFYVTTAKAGYKFAYIPDAARIFFDDATENRLSRSSIKRHARGHYISRSKMLNEVPHRCYLKNPKAWIITMVRFSQCSNYLKIDFKKRVVDTNVFYTIISYVFFPLLLLLR